MEPQGQKVVVIGSAGLIGSHTVDKLLATNIRERLFYDNFVRGREESIAVALRDPRVETYDVDSDITRHDILENAGEDCARGKISAMGADVTGVCNNSGTGARISLEEVAEKPINLTGCDQPIQFAPRSQAQSVNCSKDIDFTVSIALDDGCRSLMNRQKAHVAEVDSRRGPR
jgi:nucleoside-diphosphate-sugar epimerase